MEHIGRAGRKPSVFRSRFSVMNHEKTPILWRASSLTSCLCACMYISMYACMHVLYCNIMMLRSVMQRNATQCNTPQRKAMQCSATQRNVIQYPPTPADSRGSASEKRGQEGQGKRLAARTSGARAKRQEKETSDEKRKQQVRVAVVRPRFWRLEGCNLELVSCRFRKRR